jgi:hypothetical protein
VILRTGTGGQAKPVEIRRCPATVTRGGWTGSQADHHCIHVEFPFVRKGTVEVQYLYILQIYSAGLELWFSGKEESE